MYQLAHAGSISPEIGWHSVVCSSIDCPCARLCVDRSTAHAHRCASIDPLPIRTVARPSIHCPSAPSRVHRSTAHPHGCASIDPLPIRTVARQSTDQMPTLTALRPLIYRASARSCVDWSNARNARGRLSLPQCAPAMLALLYALSLQNADFKPLSTHAHTSLASCRSAHFACLVQQHV